MPLLYDVHTHIGLDLAFMLRGWWPYAATAQDLLTHIDAAGIDRAVCFPFTLPSAFDPYAFAERDEIKLLPGRFPFDKENALLRQELDLIDRGNRLLQFAMFDPSRSVDEQIAAIQPLLGKIKGLKAQTTVTRSPIRALLADGKPLMDLARKHNLPVLLHTAIFAADTWAQAADCVDIARAFPDIRFNLAHSLRFHEPLLRQAATLPNVWVDCSAHLAHCQLARENSHAVAPPNDRVKADYANPGQVLEAVHTILPGRYLWGSDNPFMSWCADRIAVIYSYQQEAAVLHALPAPVRQSMASTAPQAWLDGRGQ